MLTLLRCGNRHGIATANALFLVLVRRLAPGPPSLTYWYDGKLSPIVSFMSAVSDLSNVNIHDFAKKKTIDVDNLAVV